MIYRPSIISEVENDVSDELGGREQEFSVLTYMSS